MFGMVIIKNIEKTIESSLGVLIRWINIILKFPGSSVERREELSINEISENFKISIRIRRKRIDEVKNFEKEN